MSELSVKPINELKAKSLTANESRALLGVRGLVSFHIMVFHSVLYSKLEWNLVGSPQMSLFFVLSGFFLAYTSGKVKYANTPCCTELCEASKDQEIQRMNAKHFYRRRIARTLPLFYICNLASIPLIWSGHGWVNSDTVLLTSAILLMVTCTSTWFIRPVTLDGPSWFVSTVWFFYWCFPSLLPRLQAYTVEEKISGICKHFVIQVIVGFGMYAGLFAVMGFSAFFPATFWPPSRFSVFIMGVLGGLVRMESPHSYKPVSSVLCCIGFIKSNVEWTGSCQEWAAAVDREAIIVTISFLILGICEVIFGGMLGSGLWFQFMLPFSQLTIVYGLSMDNGLSTTSKILRSRVAVFFGTVSYALYLVHEPIIQYICWYTYGTQSEPICDDENSKACEQSWEIYTDHRRQPIWCIPIHLIISTVLAVCLHYLIEKPSRNFLRPQKPHQYEPKLSTQNDLDVVEITPSFAGAN